MFYLEVLYSSTLQFGCCETQQGTWCSQQYELLNPQRVANGKFLPCHSTIVISHSADRHAPMCEC